MLEMELKKNEISKNLTEAIKNGEIHQYFQPQYDYSTGKFTGAEAMCRWIHHSMGFLSPADFFPVLEKNGQIFDLDCYICDEVCRYLRRWHDMGLDVSASVNTSRIDIQEPSLYDIFCSMIEKHKIEPAWLHLEVTESAYMEDSKLLKGVVTRLMERGFIVEMDDFGSGCSSLTILKELPVDTIKLDYTFIRDALYDPRGDAIMNSIIRMSSYLNIKVIAEGVENVKSADHLLNMGCHLMQGYYFAKPMPADDFESLIKRISITSSQTKRKSENFDVIKNIINK